MWAIIKAFFTANAMRIAGIAMAGLSILGVLLGARQAGKNAERAEALEKQSKQVRRSHEIEDKNRAALRDGDAGERLRDKWSRD
jgi:hypothetical protein